MRDTRHRPMEQRFWEKVKKTDGCWLWTASHTKGYGQIRDESRFGMISAHRASWIIHYGPIPDGMCVLHRCDVPLCVNPAHLFLGTNEENVDDMIRKGRNVKGEANGESKLKVDDVRNIRALYFSGIATQAQLARKYMVYPGTISAVCTFRNWQSVADEEGA